MKRVLILLGLLLSNLILAQEYVENKPADEKGEFYTGYIKDGKYHGQGTYYYSFKRGYYKGEWKNGLKHGTGLLVQFSGNTISGKWVDNELDGKTEYRYANGGEVIYRTSVNGQYTDNYKLVYQNGTVLNGTTTNGNRDGVFTLTFKNGEQKELLYKNGELIADDGIIKDNYAYFKKYNGGTYSGEWRDDKPHGQGAFSSTSMYYRGGWTNGIKNGIGYKIYAGGDSYVGMFEDDKLNGEGIFRINKSKAYYEGSFKDNERHGQGKITISLGSTTSGNFLNGEWHGVMTFVNTNGEVTTKTYDNGDEIKEVNDVIVAKVDEPSKKTKDVQASDAETTVAVKKEIAPQYPEKLEGDDLIHFLFTEYADKKVKYWLEKHPDELFKEYEWKFTTTGLEIAYDPGKFGKEADSWDKPLNDRKAMHVEVTEGFEGKLPGGIDYKTFIDVIIQERYDLLSPYFNQITPKPYTIEYYNEDDIWDDFVMVPKNGQGALWVHGIKGFPSSFKVRFSSTLRDSQNNQNSEKYRISDRADKGGDCITCQLKKQGKKRVLSDAELEYIAAVEDAKVDLSVYENHPQLKFLGKSIHDREIIKLIAENEEARRRFIIPMRSSRYRWEDRLESEARGNENRKGYWYVLDEISGTIAGVLFIRKEDKFWKWKAYKGEIPMAEKWMETLSFKGMELYRISPDKEQSTLEANLNRHITQSLQVRANQKMPIKSVDDIDRFTTPRGDDIWRITGAPADELLNKALFAKNWSFDESYRNTYKEDNEYRIDDNSKHVLIATRSGYDYEFKGSTEGDFEKGFFPLDIRIEFDLNIFLPQVFALPEFAGAEYKERTEKVFNREVVKTTIQIELNTAYGQRYMIIDKFADQEGGRFADITFTGKKEFFSGGEKLSLNYNPWKLHNETLVAVSQEDETAYINAFEKLFINMENGYVDFPDKSAVLEDSDFRTIYLSDALEIPNTITGFSSLSKYKKSKAAWYKIKMTKATKDEYINTLFRKKWRGNYRLTAPEGDEQSTFGKGIIVEKDNQVIGILQFESHDTESGIWWMEAHTFNEDAFEKSFEKVVIQANEDSYDSWKGLPSGERDHISTYNLYNSRLSFISDSLTEANEDETDIQFIFESTPSYVLDFIIRKWQDAATSFSEEVSIKENFRRTYTTTRVVKFDFKSTQFLLVFNATHKNLNAIELGHGDNYDKITEEVFTPMNLSKATTFAIKAAQENGYQPVWSTSNDWQFLLHFNQSFSTANIPGDYMLMVVYKPTSIRSANVSFGLNGNYDGDIISLQGDRGEAKTLTDGFKFNAIKFSLGSEQANYRVGGSYGFKDDGLVLSAVLLKKK